MRKSLSALPIIFSFLACVTVNVNFPEGAVQKATDDYVRDLYRSKTKSIDDAKTSWIDFLIPSAHADAGVDAEFKIKTPKTLEIQKKMASRLDDVIKYKKEGLLGESNKGMLLVYEKKGDAPKKGLAKMLGDLVEKENRDREMLYQEVLSTNNLPENKLSNIQSSFARSFQAESPSKTWVQGATGDWEQKK